MVSDVEADRELADHRPLEAHAKKETPPRVTPVRGEQGPATGGADGRIVFNDAGEVEHVASSARVDVERDSETLLRAPVEHRGGATGHCVAGERLQPLLETLRRERGQILEDGTHGTAA